MRTLSSALQSAQEAPSSSPLLSCILQAKHGDATRLDPTVYYTDTQTDTPIVGVMDAGGFIVRARLSGGNVQTQAIGSPFTTGYTAWTTLAAAVAPAGQFSGIAMSTNAAGTILLAYLSAAGTLQAVYSLNHGSTWTAFFSETVAGSINALSICYNTVGDILTLAGDSGGTIHAWRTSHVNGATTAEPSLVPAGASSINSLAAAYSADWLVLAGWSSGSVNYLGSAIYGDAGQQAVNTWSTPINLVGLVPGSGPLINVSGFGWGSDHGHALTVEQWDVTGGYNASQVYHTCCTSPAQFGLGLWTEPEPIGLAAGFGATLQPSQVSTAQYLACGTNYVALWSAEADLDVSTRVIQVKYTQAYDKDDLEIILDNADSSLNYLAAATSTQDSAIGFRVLLELGFYAGGSNQYSQQPQRWVYAVENTWHQGRQLLTIRAGGIWHLLDRWHARRHYLWGPSPGLGNPSISGLLAWLFARVGITYLPPGSLSTLLARTPVYQIAQGHQGAAVLRDLMDKIEGWTLQQSTDTTVINLASTDPSLYTYTFPQGTNHPVLQVVYEQELQAANMVTVYTGNHAEQIMAQAFDGASVRASGLVEHIHADANLETANASLVASSLLRKAQIAVPLNTLASFPNVAQEVGDVVTFTRPDLGTQFIGRVLAYTLDYDLETGVWLQTLSLVHVQDAFSGIVR